MDTVVDDVSDHLGSFYPVKDVTTKLLDELMILSGCGVRDLYQRETELPGHDHELLPLVIACLRRITKGGAWKRSPMQYQDKLLDTAALAETLLKISKDVQDRMDSVERKATPVMAACKGYLGEQRGVVSYWFHEEEKKIRKARTSLAELTHLCWKSLEDWHQEAIPKAQRSRSTSPIEHPDKLVELDSVVTQSATQMITLLEKQPAVLFEPGGRVPVAAIKNLAPAAFEQLVSALLERDGFTVHQAVGRSGDNAADSVATGPMGLRYAVQVKHTKGNRNIGPTPVRELAGTLRRVHGSDIAVIVTNGGFTRHAVTNAEQTRVLLVDLFRLERWAEHGESLVAVLSS
ncbi:restriction endonuclease [Kitasatospora sp. NPDC088160]|uniref:restriction endonuclease n=1 Tax=Kitasatospora sp. NPDC088160 TaxID=3364072 RepID=UPI00381DF660